jgi:hypothetical protein
MREYNLLVSGEVAFPDQVYHARQPLPLYSGSNSSDSRRAQRVYHRTRTLPPARGEYLVARESITVEHP